MVANSIFSDNWVSEVGSGGDNNDNGSANGSQNGGGALWVAFNMNYNEQVNKNTRIERNR